MRRFIVASVLLLTVTVPAWAGTTTARIDKILIYEAAGQGMVYVYPVGGVNNAPTCHGSNGDYYSFAMDRPVAKEYLALLTAAHMSGSVVTLWGKGACLDQSVSETLNYLLVKQP